MRLPEEDRRDKELFIKSQEGDLDAFSQIYNRHKQKIFYYLYRYTGDYELAQDILQDAFLKAYDERKSFRFEGSVLSWLYRIAINCAKNKLINLGKHPKVSLERPIGDDELLKLSDTLKDERGKGADLKVEKDELWQAIKGALADLPPKLRKVFVMCAIQGISYEEAASILSCRIGTIKSRLNRAREFFRKRIEFKKYL